MIEVWTSPDGRLAALNPIRSTHDWYPEGPGHRPPQTYEMTDDNGDPIESFTVFPVEPWSPYDAAFDRLRGMGWVPPVQEPEPTCEHGLSASLCAGPGHYPMDY